MTVAGFTDADYALDWIILLERDEAVKLCGGIPRTAKASFICSSCERIVFGAIDSIRPGAHRQELIHAHFVCPGQRQEDIT